MRFLTNTAIPFMKYRGVWLSISLVAIVAGLASIIWGPGLKLGVDFSGGTQLTLKFQEEPDLSRVRRALEALKLGEVTIQRFDEPELHEFLVRIQTPREEGDFSKVMVERLRREFDSELSGGLDLNSVGLEVLRDALAESDPESVGGSLESRRQHYQSQAVAIMNARKEKGIFRGVEELAGVPGLSEKVRAYLQQHGRAGKFTVLAAEAVGPLVGRDLRIKATKAVAFSLLGMLIYIAVRFQLPFGIGAVVALFHDVLITLGALSLTQREINLPTVAALLTLVGYSVNDTVVIFDRIRERLKLDRGKPLLEIMNKAINQTLSRTVITSGLTLLVVLALYLFGGDVINTFAFVLLVGVIVGTYSSIYIASPVGYFFTQLFAKGKTKRARR